MPETQEARLAREIVDKVLAAHTAYQAEMIVRDLLATPPAEGGTTPPVEVKQCSPAEFEQQEAEAARLWEAFEAGRQHEATHRLMSEAALAPTPAPERLPTAEEMLGILRNTDASPPAEPARRPTSVSAPCHCGGVMFGDGRAHAPHCPSFGERDAPNE